MRHLQKTVQLRGSSDPFLNGEPAGPRIEGVCLEIDPGRPGPRGGRFHRRRKEDQQIMNRTLTLLTALLLASVARLHAADAPKRGPNVLFVISDDLKPLL